MGFCSDRIINIKSPCIVLGIDIHLVGEYGLQKIAVWKGALGLQYRNRKQMEQQATKTDQHHEWLVKQVNLARYGHLILIIFAPKR